MRVSIITPCHNSESTIRDTIESVLAQTFQDWEMIVVDDASSDASAAIVREYAARDPRIRCFATERPSGSPALPRNIGIDNASGEYIAFLDSDDLWLPEKLERQLEFVEETKAPVAYSFYEKISYDGVRSGREVRTRMRTTYSKLLTSNSIPCLTSIVRRDVIGETRFKQISQEDFCFWLDILRKGHTALNQGEVLALYREARTSRSANKFDMFIGYWRVIRRHQHIPFLRCALYTIPFTILGFAKYLK